MYQLSRVLIGNCLRLLEGKIDHLLHSQLLVYCTVQIQLVFQIQIQFAN